MTVAAYNVDNESIGVVARAGEGGFYIFNLVPAGDISTAALMRYDDRSGTFQSLAKADLKVTWPRDNG